MYKKISAIAMKVAVMSAYWSVVKYAPMSIGVLLLSLIHVVFYYLRSRVFSIRA